MWATQVRWSKRRRRRRVAPSSIFPKRYPSGPEAELSDPALVGVPGGIHTAHSGQAIASHPLLWLVLQQELGDAEEGNGSSGPHRRVARHGRLTSRTIRINRVRQQIEILIAKGSPWKYLDDGSDQNREWPEIRSPVMSFSLMAVWVHCWDFVDFLPNRLPWGNWHTGCGGDPNSASSIASNWNL